MLVRQTSNVAPARNRLALSTFVHRREPATNTFTASPLFCPSPSVWRESDTPRMFNVTDACPVTVPVVSDVNVTVQIPSEVPGFAHRSTTFVWTAPFESVSVTVTIVPSGMMTNPAPSPEFCFTVTVNVCDSSMLSVSKGGAIPMNASTNTFTASPLFGMLPSVSTWKVSGPKWTSAAACPVTVPAVDEVNVTVHKPATVPGLAHESEMRLCEAPFVSVRVTVTSVPSGADSCWPATSRNTWTVNVWG